MSAATAHRIGLVSEVCPADELRNAWGWPMRSPPARSRRSGIAAIDLGGERPRYQAGAVDGAIAADHRFRHDRYGGGQRRLFLGEADRPSDPLRRSQPWIRARAAADLSSQVWAMKTPLTSTPAPPPAAAPPPALSAGAFAAAWRPCRLLGLALASHDEDVVVLGADQRGVVDVADGVAVGEPDPVALPGHAVGHRHLALRSADTRDVVDKADFGARLKVEASSSAVEGTGESSGRCRRGRHRRDGIGSSGIG